MPIPPPILYSKGVVAGNLRNHTKHCHFIVPGDNLSINISGENVVVTRTDKYPLKVLSARAREVGGRWALVVKTESVPKRDDRGDTEEIEVTVTNPDTGDSSEPPTEPPIEVVYYDEENPPPDPPPIICAESTLKSDASESGTEEPLKTRRRRPGK